MSISARKRVQLRWENRLRIRFIGRRFFHREYGLGEVIDIDMFGARRFTLGVKYSTRELPLFSRPAELADSETNAIAKYIRYPSTD